MIPAPIRVKIRNTKQATETGRANEAQLVQRNTVSTASCVKQFANTSEKENDWDGRVKKVQRGKGNLAGNVSRKKKGVCEHVVKELSVIHSQEEQCMCPQYSPSRCLLSPPTYVGSVTAYSYTGVPETHQVSLGEHKHTCRLASLSGVSQGGPRVTAPMAHLDGGVPTYPRLGLGRYGSGSCMAPAPHV